MYKTCLINSIKCIIGNIYVYDIIHFEYIYRFSCRWSDKNSIILDTLDAIIEAPYTPNNCYSDNTLAEGRLKAILLNHNKTT